MSGQTLPSNPTIDPYQHLQIVRNADGTITRNPNIDPDTDPTPTPDPSHPTPVLSKDIPINQSNKTWARIYLPKHALDSSSTGNKLPLIVYFHGGGFIISSAASNLFQVFCSDVASELPCIMVSVDYRLAPEHRLPAAYDDAVEALHWIKTTNEIWLRDYADFDNVFLMGSSAGGNLAYHAGLRAAAQVDNILPLNIRGLILHQPFFGGAQRSQSELRLINDPVFPLAVADVAWELSLPIGVDRDHEYCNPMAGGGSKLLEKISLLKWRVLVTGCDGDPLIDRQIELVKLMEEKGVKVVGQFGVGGLHGIEFVDPSKANTFYVVLKSFTLSSMAT